MTNKEWLAKLSNKDWYMKVHWLFNTYGKNYNNSYLAILDWLDEEHTGTAFIDELIDTLRKVADDDCFYMQMPTYFIRELLKVIEEYKDKTISREE